MLQLAVCYSPQARERVAPSGTQAARHADREHQKDPMHDRDRRRTPAWLPPPSQDERVQQTGLLAQEMSRRLFSAGLDLNYVLMTLDADSPVADRAWHAVEQIDEAIVLLRNLMSTQAEHG
jgi:hypothetical protein